MSPRNRYLHISDNLKLPVSILSEAWAVLGTRGSGKTYAAKKIVEEALKIHYPVVVFDPMHAWWGLRSGADGRAEGGLPITIFGGPRGDLPLEPEAGSFFADLIAGEGISCIFDIKLWSKTKRRLFVADFAERFIQKNQDPVCVVFEEMSRFAPQTTRDKGDNRMLGAVVELATEGRQSGIGVGGVSQRSARVHKDFLEETDSLLMMRTGGINDRKTMRNWITTHELDEEDYVSDVLRELPRLDTGTGYFWAPVLFDAPVYIEVNEAETFDSSATPKAGQRRRRPKTVMEIDKERIASQMSEFIERAEREDPKKLQQRITQLERELKKRPDAPPKVEKEYILDAVLVKKLDSCVRSLQQGGGQLQLIAGEISTALSAAKGNVVPISSRSRGVESKAPASREADDSISAPARDTNDDVQVKAGARRMLEILVKHYPMKLTKSQLAQRSKMKQSGTFATYMSILKNAGYIEAVDGNLWQATDAGIDYLGIAPGNPQTADEVIEMWRGSLKAGARRMFDHLVDLYPHSIEKDELANAIEMTQSGTFSTYLSILKSNELAEIEGSEVKAHPALFEVGA